jgi:hypothetical protein
MTKQEMIANLEKRIKVVDSLREGDLDALNALSKAFLALAELQDSVKHEAFQNTIMASQGMFDNGFFISMEDDEKEGKVLSIVDDENEE